MNTSKETAHDADDSDSLDQPSARRWPLLGLVSIVLLVLWLGILIWTALWYGRRIDALNQKIDGAVRRIESVECVGVPLVVTVSKDERSSFHGPSAKGKKAELILHQEIGSANALSNIEVEPKVFFPNLRDDARPLAVVYVKTEGLSQKDLFSQFDVTLDDHKIVFHVKPSSKVPSEPSHGFKLLLFYAYPINGDGAVKGSRVGE